MNSNTINQLINQLQELKTQINKPLTEKVLEIDDGDKINIIGGDVERCPVCLDDIGEKNKVVLGCGHQLHLDCYNSYLTSSIGNEYNNIKRCMLCRTEIEGLPSGFGRMISRIQDDFRIQQEREQQREQRRERDRLFNERWEQEQQRRLQERVANQVEYNPGRFIRNTSVERIQQVVNEGVDIQYNRRNVASILINNLERERIYTEQEIYVIIQGVSNRSDNNISTGIQRLLVSNHMVSMFFYDNEGRHSGHGYIRV